MEDSLPGHNLASETRLVAGERSSVLANAPIPRQHLEKNARGNTNKLKDAKFDRAKV